MATRLETSRTTAPMHLAYPSLRRAAEMIGVNVSTLSRRKLEVVRMGSQKRLSPRTVMEESAYFNRRDPNEVAAELVELAEDQWPELAEAIELEITQYMQTVENSDAGQRPGEEWLADAERFLPANVFARVKDVYERAGSTSATGLSGPAPT